MGLPERRAAREFETKRFPELLRAVHEAACVELPVEVVWADLIRDDSAHLFDDCWTRVFFEPLIAALKGITFDDMGKDAVKTGLKKVVIRSQSGAYYGDRIATFVDGVLTLDHEPFTNVDAVEERTKGIQTTLEKAL